MAGSSGADNSFMTQEVSPQSVAKGSNAPAHVDALTSVRFLAALSVLLAHFDESLEPLIPGALYGFIHRGGTAVMFFFVLSGFIMTHVYQTRDLSTRQARKTYFVARFARIAPLYYIALGMGLLNIIAGANKGAYPVSIWLGSIVSKFTFTQALFPAVVKDPAWALVTWTLSVEACFYVLFPFILIKFLDLKPRGLLIVALIAVCYSAAIPQLAQNMTDAAMGQRVWYLNAFMYPGFFLIGMIVRRAQDRYADLAIKYWPLLLGMGCGIIGSVRVFEVQLWLTNSGHLMGSSLVLLGLFNAKGVVSQVFQQRQFVLLGEASYALYLIHGPVGSILEKLKIHPKEHFSHFILFTLVAIAVSIASFKLVEIPARNWITSRFKNPSSRIKGSASTS